MAKAPNIAIRCECGSDGSVPYGERWTCPECGRTWNTAQIPADAYDRRRRQMRRFYLEIVAFAIVFVGAFVPIVLFVDSGYVFLAGIVGLAWMLLYMPFWRRRLRRAVASAPSWDLHAE